MTSVQLEHISKRFGSAVVLDDINLTVAPGELLFLLGPSGCGKSTLLRIIAGLLEPSAGKILFNGKDVTSAGTEQRNAVMCFQNYALWPHMSVRENVGFGLSIRSNNNNNNNGNGHTASRVDEALRLVQLHEYAERKPNALSGGQQQRAALARALAVAPQCLLLDEPLSNLDAKLRLEMRSEIKRICKTSGYTTIYVTHDQKEALSIADRIVVLKDGKIVQIGIPAELYYKPQTSFVADFIGQTNLLTGTVEEQSADSLHVKTDVGLLLTQHADFNVKTGQTVLLSVRPERIRILSPDLPKSESTNDLAGKLVENTFLGEASEHVVQINGHRLRISSSPPMLSATDDVLLEISPDDCVVLRK